MPFTQNNNMSNFNGGGYNNNNNQNNNSGAPEKSNFNVGRMWGKHPTDAGKVAVLDVGIYASKYAVFASFAIKYEMGKLSNGQVQFEAGLAKDNPSSLLNAEQLTGLITLLDHIEQKDVPSLNLCIDSGKSKFSIVGSETQVQITVSNDKGTKSITFDAMPAGVMNIHSSLELLKKYLIIIQKKQLSYRLSPDVFGEEPAATQTEDSSSPF